MKFEQTNYTTGKQILANDHYVAKPIFVDFTGITGDVKAGTPLNANGKAATTTPATESTPASTDAIGILLNDTTSDNPNSALLIHGFIDTAKAQANSSVTINSTTKAALPMILFM